MLRRSYLLSVWKTYMYEKVKRSLNIWKNASKSYTLNVWKNVCHVPKSRTWRKPCTKFGYVEFFLFTCFRFSHVARKCTGNSGPCPGFSNQWKTNQKYANPDQLSSPCLTRFGNVRNRSPWRVSHSLETSEIEVRCRCSKFGDIAPKIANLWAPIRKGFVFCYKTKSTGYYEFPKPKVRDITNSHT